VAAPYVGQNDYRGYLSYLGSQGDTNAQGLLNYVGNDARFDTGKAERMYGNAATREYYNRLNQANQTLYQQFQNMNKPGSIAPLYGGGGGGGGPRPVYAPKLDIGALNAQARSAAEGAVNPYYTKVLNEFLAAQAARRQQRQTQAQTDITNIQDSLKSALELSQLNRERTTEDVGKNLENIATTADQFQTDTGEEFALGRNQLAEQTAAAGLTGGLGAQQQERAVAGRNLQEERQVKQFQEQKNVQAQFKTRTFEDLMRQDTENTGKAEKGKKQVQFDLDSYIQNLGFEESDTRNKLEQERLGRVGDESRNQARLAFNNYLAGIKDPAQLQAAVATYGGQI